MPLSELLINEYDGELANTKRVLERVPVDKWDWKPDAKSGSLGWMASHVATLPGFAIAICDSNNYEIEGGARSNVDKPGDLLKVFEQVGKDARAAISKVSDEQMKENWSLTWKGKMIMEMPRYSALRGACFNHLIHHRGQLTTYLRALGAPVPGLYGPSADEKFEQ
jgi:uncharacterized damage-inducible protein DinB